MGKALSGLFGAGSAPASVGAAPAAGAGERPSGLRKPAQSHAARLNLILSASEANAGRAPC